MLVLSGTAASRPLFWAPFFEILELTSAALFVPTLFTALADEAGISAFFEAFYFITPVEPSY